MRASLDYVKSLVHLSGTPVVRCTLPPGPTIVYEGENAGSPAHCQTFRTSATYKEISFSAIFQLVHCDVL